ncbi:NAD(P)-binding domain-containing protein [Actinomadura sp. 9N215]|uniref:NAD(P)-binding domain-containing protein n=1 Tax=Actinomadura sp. 9N215 TaxID=3375150 RepID=UPI00379276D5
MTDHAAAHIDYLLIGAGPGNLQLAHHLQRADADYLVLERGQAPGTFFRRFPRHRTLISINKPHVGGLSAEAALRYDWNSLLSDDERLLFTRYTPRYFPAADDYVRYLGDYANELALDVRFGIRIERIDKPDRFEAIDQDGRVYSARNLIIGTGLSAPRLPAIPGIEHAEPYRDFDTDPAGFTDQRVLIIGKGNSAFETAESLTESAATLHLASPNPIRFAWKTRYVGHLRAVNNDFLDTYHLKSQNAVLDAHVTRIRRANGGLVVDFSYTHASGERIQRYYDRVIACTGFRFDDSIFAPAARPVSCHDGRYPAQTSEWESVNVPGMFFAGTLMHARDYRRTMSGFVHGFRYNVRFLADLLLGRNGGQRLASREVPRVPEKICESALRRINTSSAMFLQPGYFCDVITDAGGETLRHYSDIPYDYVLDSELSSARWFSITLEYGPEADDPFNIVRDTDPSWARLAPFLHPVARVFDGTRQIDQLHLLEDLENKYSSDKHGRLLTRFFDEHIRRAELNTEPAAF